MLLAGFNPIKNSKQNVGHEITFGRKFKYSVNFNDSIKLVV